MSAPNISVNALPNTPMRRELRPPVSEKSRHTPCNRYPAGRFQSG